MQRSEEDSRPGGNRKGQDYVKTQKEIQERLDQLLLDRSWSEYRLAKECGLSESTIANIYRRNSVPSIATLEAICRGFGISMAQFFAENEMVELTPQTRELFECWRSLTSEQKEGLLTIMRLLGNT